MSSVAPEPDDHIVYLYRHAAPHSDRLREVIQTAAANADPPLTVWSDQHINVGDDIAQTIREAIRTSSGAVALLSEDSVSLGVELGMSTQSGVPLLLVHPTDVDSTIVRGGLNALRVVRFEETRGNQAWREVEEQVVRWIASLRRPQGHGDDALADSERRDIEAFLTAFHKAVHDGSLDLDGEALLTVSVHVETLNLQLRAPEPDRGVIKSVLRAIGPWLLGVGGSVAGNYLYALLPHLH